MTGPPQEADLPVGRTWPTHEYSVGREKIREYAAAIGDGSPIFHDPDRAREAGFPGLVAPPLFAVVFVAPAVAAVVFDPAVRLYDPEVGLSSYRFVHRAQRFDWERPVVEGDVLRTSVRLADAGERDGRSYRIFESETLDHHGSTVLTGRYEGVTIGGGGSRRSGGISTKPLAADPAAPTFDGSLAALAPGSGLPTLVVTPDRYVGVRYAGASGDFTPFHYDPEAARAVGLPGVILHGLYSMAQLVRAHTEPFGGDPRRLRSVACRFRAPGFPEEEMVVRPVVSSVSEEVAEVRSEVWQGDRQVIGEGSATLVV